MSRRPLDSGSSDITDGVPQDIVCSGGIKIKFGALVGDPQDKDTDDGE